MGEITNLILSGELCQECGDALDDDLDFAHSCAPCQNTHQIKRKANNEIDQAKPGTPHFKP